jgi:hypothetical protein
MKLKLVPARRGVRWVRDGVAIFFRKPLAFCLLLLVYLLVGPMLMLAVAPLASLGFMIATRRALQGRFPLPGVFIEPLAVGSAQRWAQIKLGLGYAVVAGLALWLAIGIGGTAMQALGEAMRSGDATSDEIQRLLDDPSVQSARLVLVVCVALLAIPFWHAPALVHWGGVGAAQALFYSTVACWRNKGAMTVYMLTWWAVTVLVALVWGLVAMLVGMNPLSMGALAPAVVMVSSAFYASLYFTFAESFDPAAADATAAPPTLETP